MKKIIVAIDGFSSCGKSTTARQLAKKLDYIFIDSGAMYRAITLYFVTHKVDVSDAVQVAKALSEIHLSFRNNASTGNSDMYLNGENVAQEIRAMSISEQVSDVAAVPAVRIFAVAQQQAMGAAKGIVMDGRDIGTTVFPNAELKIFMTASLDKRVERRWLELTSKGEKISKEEVMENLKKRDYIDSHREVSPLRQAEDAVVLDNTNLTMEQQLATAENWAKEKMQ